METDAKLQIQESIRNKDNELVWSFVLDYENDANPRSEVRKKIAEWKHLAAEDVDYSSSIRERATEYMLLGLRQKDASHIACAVEAGCNSFLTTDKKILSKSIGGIELTNPIDYVRRQEDAI
jgi:predicted nucleic acid-binding protein